MTQTTPQNITFRRGDERGATQLDWLHSRHSFSFGQYYDPDNVGYRSLRVINDDVISPGTGFGEHPHEHMEILTWVLEGALRHGDSLGHTQRLEPGELQAMSAGTGIRHSEFNDSTDHSARFLQIWITPTSRDVKPRYDQRRFDAADRRNRWQTLASGSGVAGALPIHQDAEMRVADLDAKVSLAVKVPEGRYGYIHVATGSLRAGGRELTSGDAFTAAPGTDLTLTALGPAQVIGFDLA